MNDVEDGAVASDEGAVSVGKNGIYVGGDVAGDVLGAGARKTIVTAEQAYQVHGLPNPYLGLRSFTYDDRAAFAGRESAVRQAVEKLTDPGSPISLLFVTGASGCGKSSFVQAGLLPALEIYYLQRHKRVCRAVFRPSTAPLAMLADAFEQLGFQTVTAEQLAGFTSDDFNKCLSENTPKNQLNLLVIDQFEESFTQSIREQRERLFVFLAGLSAFSKVRTHVIITIRVDYLDDLFAHAALWQVAKQGVELRAMSDEELKEAIQQPLNAAGEQKERYQEKRFESALLDKLAENAAQDPAYLPLLQVTLQELWKGGSLVLDRYGTLSDAIRQRAEWVYGFEDYDAAAPEQARQPTDQDEILKIFTDLVEVSLSDDIRRDVRRRRLKSELIGNSIQRNRLVDSLIQARLLSTSREVRAKELVDVIDIIHESLITNWERLGEAVSTKRQTLQRRVRFEQALTEWKANDQGESYLLGGVRLAEGRELELAGDVALRSDEGQVFMRASQAKAEAAQKRIRNTFLTVLFVVTSLAVAASWFAYQTVQQSRAVLSTALATQSQNLAKQELSLRLLLAVEAFKLSPTHVAQEALIGALAGNANAPIVLRGHDGAITTIAFSPDSRWMASGSEDWTTRLWDMTISRTATAKPIILRGIDGPVEIIDFSADGAWLAIGNQFGTVNLWKRNLVDADSEAYSFRESLYNSLGAIRGIAFSSDNHYLFSGVNKSSLISSSGSIPEVNVVDLTDINPADTLTPLRNLPNGDVTDVAVSPDDRWLVAGCSGEIVNVAEGTFIAPCKFRLWKLDELATDPVLLPASDREQSMVAFSPDGHWLFTTSGRFIYIWDMTAQDVEKTRLELLDHRRAITSIAISADSHWLVSGSNKKSFLPWQQDAPIRVWDLSGWPISPISVGGHGQTVEAMSISADSRWLATGGKGSILEVWDLQDLGSPNVTFGDQQGAIRAITFSPDGRWLASGGDDRSIWLRSDWQGSSASLIDLACQVAGRNLTRDEWDSFLVDKDYRKTCDEWQVEAVDDYARWQFWHWAVWPTIRGVLLFLASLVMGILVLFVWSVIKAIFESIKR